MRRFRGLSAHRDTFSRRVIQKPVGVEIGACFNTAKQGGVDSEHIGCDGPTSWPCSCPVSVLVRGERYSIHSIIKYSQAKACLDPHFWITDLLMGWLRELNHLVFEKIENI